MMLFHGTMNLNYLVLTCTLGALCSGAFASLGRATEEAFVGETQSDTVIAVGSRIEAAGFFRTIAKWFGTPQVASPVSWYPHLESLGRVGAPVATLAPFEDLGLGDLTVVRVPIDARSVGGDAVTLSPRYGGYALVTGADRVPDTVRTALQAYYLHWMEALREADVDLVVPFWNRTEGPASLERERVSVWTTPDGQGLAIQNPGFSHYPPSSVFLGGRAFSPSAQWREVARQFPARGLLRARADGQPQRTSPGSLQGLSALFADFKIHRVPDAQSSVPVSRIEPAAVGEIDLFPYEKHGVRRLGVRGDPSTLDGIGVERVAQVSQMLADHFDELAAIPGTQIRLKPPAKPR